jgi:hypothetical protein
MRLASRRDSLVNARFAAVNDQNVSTVTVKQPIHDLLRESRASPIAVADN